MAPRARQAKGKARLAAYEKLLAEEGMQKIEQIEIYLPPGPRLGNVVIEADQLRKGYGENLLMEDLTFKLPPAGIVGVIGPNGAGKTTLFRMITGRRSRTRAHCVSATRSSSATWTRAAIPCRPTPTCGRRSPRARTRSSWGSAR
jgi:ATPase subunit of ABC transporter with duplicated ATPase domains